VGNEGKKRVSAGKRKSLKSSIVSKSSKEEGYESQSQKLGGEAFAWRKKKPLEKEKAPPKLGVSSSI